MGLFGSERRRLLGALGAAVLCLLPAVVPLIHPSPSVAWSVQAGRALAAEGDPYLWAVGGPGPDEARHLAVDVAGSVYLAGMFSEAIDVDPGPGTVGLTSVGSVELFLAKYAPCGDVVWAFDVGGPGVDQVYQVLLDPFGNIYLAGSFAGEVDFAPGEPVALVRAGGERDGFVAKYGPGGQLLMGRRQPGGTDALLAKYAPDGRLAWAQSFGGPTNGPGQSSLASTVVVDPRGDVLLAGRFFGADVSFDPGGGAAVLRSAGQSDAFLAKYGPDGALQRR